MREKTLVTSERFKSITKTSNQGLAIPIGMELFQKDWNILVEDEGYDKLISN